MGQVAVALAFAVLGLTGSIGDLAVVVGARSIANVALLLVGGVLADRIPRALPLQGASLAGALTEATLAASVLVGFASIPLLTVIGVVNGAVDAVSFPASAAITPQTVPAGEIQQANAVARMAANLAGIAGASLGGLLASVVGPGWAMVVAALMFAAESLGFLRIRGLTGAPPRSTSHPLTDLRDGWREFASRTWVWVVVVQFMLVNAVMVGGVQVLGPKIADNTIGRTGWGLALPRDTAAALTSRSVRTLRRLQSTVDIVPAGVT